MRSSIREHGTPAKKSNPRHSRRAAISAPDTVIAVESNAAFRRGAHFREHYRIAAAVESRRRWGSLSPRGSRGEQTSWFSENIGRRHGHAVAVGDVLAWAGGHARVRRDGAREGGWIAGGELYHLFARRRAADGAEGLERLGQGELLAHEGADHASAPQLAPHIEPPVDAEQIAPGGRVGLAGHEITKDHAVAPHVLSGPRFQHLVGGRRGGRVEERPASGADGGVQGAAAPAALTAPLFGVEQAAQAREAVARN